MVSSIDIEFSASVLRLRQSSTKLITLPPFIEELPHNVFIPAICGDWLWLEDMLRWPSLSLIGSRPLLIQVFMDTFIHANGEKLLHFYLTILGLAKLAFIR